MITAKELDEATALAVDLGERINSWGAEDQGQLSVGAFYAHMHITGLASTLGGMRGILDHLAKA